MIWRLTEGKAAALTQTSLAAEELLESHLEDWIEQHPEMLEERLIIIGRQVPIVGIGDRIDLLGVDPRGALVVIELKRDSAGGDVDFQALRYASYVSRWSYNDVRTQAERYAASEGLGEDFVDELEEFLEEDAELNSTQRIIIVGGRLRDKIGSVALWLLEREVDIKVVELQPFSDEDGSLYASPTVVVPPPTAEEYELGKISRVEPWLGDSRRWHLDERCSAETAQLLERLEQVILGLPEITSSWRQKFYVAFDAHNITRYHWLVVETRKGDLYMLTRLPKNELTIAEVADALGLPESKIDVRDHKTCDELGVKLPPDFDVEAESFTRFVREAYDAFPSIWEDEAATTDEGLTGATHE